MKYLCHTTHQGAYRNNVESVCRFEWQYDNISGLLNQKKWASETLHLGQRHVTMAIQNCVMKWSIHALVWNYWGGVTHICVSELTSIDSVRRQAIIWSNSALRNIQNLKVFVQGNALENVACKLSYILSRPQRVNGTWVHHPRTIASQNTMNVKLIIFALVTDKISLQNRTCCRIDDVDRNIMIFAISTIDSSNIPEPHLILP